MDHTVNPLTAEDQRTLDRIETRLRSILPEEYQDSYDAVEPVSMGSAGLKRGPDGSVAWNEMWQTFCDLAMAGGPPHKGKLLEPGTVADIEATPARYAQVSDEICRGVKLVTGLPARRDDEPGWILVCCSGSGMAGWLLRAIVMENVSARADGAVLYLPSGPAYRLEKEIKNVVTVIAKTCHYWTGHLWGAEQRFIADMFTTMARETPLVVPARPRNEQEAAEVAAQSDRIAQAIAGKAGLPRGGAAYAGWAGVDCPDVHGAVWMMRMLVAGNVLARREDTTLFVPINPGLDRDGAVVVDAVARTRRFAAARQIF